MSIVVDANCIPPLFNSEDISHSEFIPVRKWILSGKGKLVYGGSAFIGELEKISKYYKIIKLLRDAHKACRIRRDVVDQRESEVKVLTSGTSCDDPHIIALLDVSKCVLLCSKDSRSYPFVKNRTYYRSSIRVKIYSKPGNAKLLCPSNNVTLCNVE